MGKKTPVTKPRTTAINPAAIATSLTAFSPLSASSKSAFYAHLHAAPDAHTLRVYDVDSGRCTSRWASNAAGAEGAASSSSDDEPRVKSIEWCWVPSASATTADNAAQGEGKRGKKRRKSDGGGAVDSPAKPANIKVQPPQLTLALGLENGSVLLWHPNGTASRTLSHPTSTSPITALASPVSSSSQEDGHLWTAHADGSVRLWDVTNGSVLGKVSGLKEEARWDDLLVRYEAASEEGGKRTAHLVLSHLSLHAYSVQLSAPSKKEGKVRDLKATELGRCTGHVEPCSIRWTGLSSSASPASSSAVDMTDADSPASPADKLTFLSYSPTDRFVQVWSLPLNPATTPANGTLLARLATDSGVSAASVSPLLPSSQTQTLAAIDSATGNVSLTALPLSFTSSAVASASPSKKAKKHGAGVVALEALCEITAPAAGGRSEAGIAEVAFRSQEEGKALLCRGGVKPVFEVAAFKEEGAWVSKLDLARSANNLLVGASGEQSAGAPQPARYSEQSSSAVAATTVPDAAADSDDDEVVNAGELDVDAAEPTLADRLKALNVSQKTERRKAARKARAAQDGLDDDVEVASESSGSEDEDDFDGADEDVVSAVPATTLTTTLIQALHSSDGPLLESCLAHSNPALVRSTVKRLPSGGLVLSLLEAIVDRLGKEKKGREGMASVKRAKALVGWLKETLIIHVGFLVTIPSLVNRLSALHASLTQRLALQAPLLALNGRLELVMSQIDLRQDRARAVEEQQARSAAAAAKRKVGGRRYVEGESTDEDEDSADGDEDLEEEDLSEGDVEDVVLGGAGSDGEFDSEDDDVDSAFEDEEDGPDGAPRHKRNSVSNLLDLEAEDDESFDESEADEDGFNLDGGDEDEEEAGEDSEFEE